MTKAFSSSSFSTAWLSTRSLARAASFSRLGIVLPIAVAPRDGGQVFRFPVGVPRDVAVARHAVHGPGTLSAKGRPLQPLPGHIVMPMRPWSSPGVTAATRSGLDSLFPVVGIRSRHGTSGRGETEAPIRFEVVHATHFQGVADVGNLPVAPNLPPTEGLRFFGRAHVEGATESMTGERNDLDDRVLHSVELAPAAASRDSNVDRGGLHPRPPRGAGGGAWRGRIPGPTASSTQVSRASSARRRRYAEYAAISPRTGARQARYLARTSSSRSQS